MIDIQSKDFKYLKFLKGVATDNKTEARCRLAALLVHKNVPIALGKNQLKSHPLQAKFGMNEHSIYLHAEIDALIKGVKELNSEQLNKSTLYVARVLRDGTTGLAKPCPGCQRALKSFGIERIVWTTENGFNTSENEHLDETRESYEIKRNLRGKKINYSSFHNYQNASGA